ncbi:FAD/NAD(P)-dependent oxidoreductase [Acetobacter oeni]|uniref:FAD/NAD(P)-binding oxidoreductase n=1 Tax=Acetobacter oeni TaxID=304077 RepID=A0A511XNR1_9PROT|nr:FAD/NAD(P)-binding oxidoreductase [Acetobacter oeni]MBB3884417.1 NADPH-dependent 2,4-dienoyl-CoA reductase/sulfur reductase-like enzyme [Acetobacter oeni]NHO20361.1 FAD-binding protein [Acetobacter oeni]GBR09889.1 FAD-dependent pyridine nucleotide-disulfide oxidoreductase [Acetobacter oeni LMG 21952]GEN64582.1 FAD/NAD(P)-binding oxidoreductase [Acetobacter oeni]
MDAPVIVVIGAGPAGTRAAQTLACAGLRPIVLDENQRQGGQIYRRQPENFTRAPAKLYGASAAAATALHADFEALRPSLDYQPETLAWGVSGDMLLTECRGHADAVRFDGLIIASGATDRIMPCPGWTLPGVFSLGGSQIALKAQACAIGQAPVFMGTGPLLYLVAWQYLQAGVKPRAVLDTSSLTTRLRGLGGLRRRPAVLAQGLRYMAGLARAGITLRSGIRPVRIESRQDGETPCAGAVIWKDGQGRTHRTDCDAVGIGYGLRSETQLADLLKCDFAFDATSRQWLPVTDRDGATSRAGVYLAGDGAGIRGADAAESAGALAALRCLQDIGRPVMEGEMTRLRAALEPMNGFRHGLETGFPWPWRHAAGLPDDTVVCRCENVTAGDIRRAAGPLDSPEINRAKAFVRVGMGRCQGRMCGLAAAEILAAARGVAIEEAGRVRSAAPLKPLPAKIRGVVT